LLIVLSSLYFHGLTNQANRPRADGAPAPPASGPVEREVGRHIQAEAAIRIGTLFRNASAVAWFGQILLTSREL
jgi:hypothetical protein